MDNPNSCYSSSGDSSASSITTNASSISASTITTTSSTATDPSATNRDHFLRHLNKLSHKISKPTSSSSAAAGSFVRRPPLEPPVHHRPPPPMPPLQPQPPVYNINKSDFRDVVQKLTGSPAHDRIQATAPTPIHAPKPASSRLQRIRPPPLAQLSHRPPPMLNCAVPPMNPVVGGFIRHPAPLSPLPPLPPCHAAAESPVSAYMRFLHNSFSAVDSDPKFNNLPEFNSQPILPQPQLQQHPVNHPPPSSTADSLPPPPSSPLPFGCLLSPKSPCPLLSPNLLFSPTGNGRLGFPQLPVSPTVPGVPSPKWRDI